MNPTSTIGHILELLERTDRSPQPSDNEMAEFFRRRRYIGSHERRQIAECVFGIIRNRRFVEAIIEEFLAAHPDAAALDAPHRRYLAVYTAYSLLRQTGSIPGPEVSQSPLPSPQYWTTLYPSVARDRFIEWMSCNTVPQIDGTSEVIKLAVRHSFQDWMAAEWSARLGDETMSLMESLNRPARTTLRVNLLKCTRDECRRRLSSEGLEMTPTVLSPAGLDAQKRFSASSSPAFQAGWYELQDEGSQIVALAASPSPGAMVIDACSGAGGKSLHMAALMEGRGDILAIDVDDGRLRELRLRAKRAGITIIRTSLSASIEPERLAGAADLVLVDAPCSGAGTIRRNPWLKWKLSEDAIGRFASRELDILQSNARFVKPGGTLLYATCSLLEQENERVVEQFLGADSSFAPDPLPVIAGLPESGRGAATMSLYPHRHNTDGFFMARMRRVAAA